MESLINSEGMKPLIVQELTELGCCDLCILRYLGNTEAHIYRGGADCVKKILLRQENGTSQHTTNEDQEPSAKLLKRSACTTCLGLLDSDHGASERLLNEVVAAVKKADVQAKSYTVNLSLPIAVQFRAYFIWFHLIDKFPQIYDCFPTMRPEAVCLKNAWKWICTAKLKELIDPDSEWGTEGSLQVNIAMKYADDVAECQPLKRLRKSASKKSGPDKLSRGNVEALMKDMRTLEFQRKFGDTPPVATNHLDIQDVSCIHVPVFVAGRYRKHSRNVSQTPWIIDGKRFHDGSVEELISEQILPVMKAEQLKFSASGREDVDVRMIGEGRPFLLEIINPKLTFFTQVDMNKLRNVINTSTELISVRDLQLVEKKAAGKLKEGEEFKTKTYCALCRIPSGEVTPEILNQLNNIQVPLVLQQKTPIRVLHRRSLATRERSIYSIKAVACKSTNLFKLYVQTQAGTYVKEFVHGDMGRTKPSVAEILNCDADIVSLDVERVDFNWPPTITDDDEIISNSEQQRS